VRLGNTVRVQLEGRGRETSQLGMWTRSRDAGFFGQRRDSLGYQGLLCMFEYMIEAHCLGSRWGLALGLPGSVLPRLRESSTWGGAWRRHA